MSVNDLLNNLRGEQFRHAQNLRGSRSHLRSYTRTNRTTLPPGLFGPEDIVSEPSSPPKQAAPVSHRTLPCSGPKPPKSWTALTSAADNYNSVEWRIEALSTLFKVSEASVPPLTLLCLRKLLSISSADEFKNEIVSFLPPHLRRDLLHWTAVHSPLANDRLFPLHEPDGHAAGELIVVGPAASLPNDYFVRPTANTSSISSTLWEEADFWDSDDNSDTSTLHTFVLLSARLTVSTLLTLPRTLTHMALINLPVAISLYRLPGICPLLVFLDLSYNKWLRNPEFHATAKDTGTKMLEKLDWTRWMSLKTLVLRDCHVTSWLLEKVNKGRWDVQVIL